jgi:tetratricopeptide (TPR) repeat protein
MRNVKNIIVIGIILISAISTYGQKVKSYYIIMPPYVVTNVDKIFIEDFVCEGEKGKGEGANFSKIMKDHISSEHRGISFEETKYIYNPWLKTNLYEVTENEAEAGAKISGNFTVTSASSYNENKVETVEPDRYYNRIPYSYYNYSASSSATIDVNMSVYKKELDKVVFEIPVKKEGNDSKTTSYSKPVVSSEASMMQSTINSAINYVPGYFCPVLRAIEYDFEKVKVKDKELKNEIKDVKGLVKDGKFKEAAVIYKKAMDVEKNQEAAYNLGIIYELHGNYTKARECYMESGNSAAVARIDKGLEVIDLLKKMNKEIVEQEIL